MIQLLNLMLPTTRLSMSSPDEAGVLGDCDGELADLKCAQRRSVLRLLIVPSLLIPVRVTAHKEESIVHIAERWKN